MCRESKDKRPSKQYRGSEHRRATLINKPESPAIPIHRQLRLSAFIRITIRVHLRLQSSAFIRITICVHLRLQLLVAQRFDGIEAGGFEGGIDAKDEGNARHSEDSRQRPGPGEGKRRIEE